MQRNVELDMFKLMLVIGMIIAHVYQLLYNENQMWVGVFSTYINAVTFSGFLFAFGCATQLAYLRKPKDKTLRTKLMKNGIRLLLAFYISGFAYTIFVSQNISVNEAFKILSLWSIPGYSEFLLSFAMLMPLVWMFYRQLVTLSIHKFKLGGQFLSL